MAIIFDPDGHFARVNDENQLVVRAINESELIHASTLGQGYAWTSGAVSWTANDTCVYIRNDGSTPLVIDRVSCAGDASGRTNFAVYIGAYANSETLAGTQVTATNMNEVFTTTAPEATAYSDETGVDPTTGNIVDWFSVEAEASHQHNLDGAILGKNHYIAIVCETASTDATRVSVQGHFAAPE